MELNKILQGDCMSVIKTLPNKSVNCVITSPPYWQLRDYGWNGQWGLEPTFQMYLENLWSLMDEIYRVLSDDGTAWINLGDTYNGVKKGNTSNKGYCENTVIDTFAKPKQDKIEDKCLLLIPHRFAIGCIDRGWIMRNDVVWAKRNAMPESATDRFSKKHEYFFFMAKNQDYYFDLENIRIKSLPLNRWGGNKLVAKGVSQWDEGTGQTSYRDRDMQPNNGMKNPGDVSDFWDIPTRASKDKHYAQYNTQLIDRCIVAGCPIGGVILDPFCGTATTGCRAIDLDRKFIGIEGNEEYVKIGNKKLLPFQISQKLF
jgi:DNA modification methylase